MVRVEIDTAWARVSPAPEPATKEQRMADDRIVLLCSCEDTMPLDDGTVRKACRGAEVKTARQLCRAELDRFRAAAATGRPAHGRLHPGGAAVRRDRRRGGRPTSLFANIRETAGWSADAAAAGPKMAALIAAAAEPLPPTPFVTLESEGVVLVYGRDEQAIEAAKLLEDAPRRHGAAHAGRPTSRRRASPSSRWCRARSARPRGISARSSSPSTTMRRRRPPRAARSRSGRRATAPRRAATSCSISPAARRCFRRPTCATAICAPIRAIRPRCCARC